MASGDSGLLCEISVALHAFKQLRGLTMSSHDLRKDLHVLVGGSIFSVATLLPAFLRAFDASLPDQPYQC